MEMKYLRKYICILATLLLANALFAQEAVRSVDAKRSESLIIDAVAAINAGKYDDAATLLNASLAKDPSNDAAYYYLGIVNVHTRKLAAATDNFRKAVELDPDNFWYRTRLAKIYQVSNEPEMTLAMYEELMKDFPKKSELYYELADLYIRQNQPEKALETIAQIEIVFGRSEPTAMTKFQLLSQLQRQEEAYQSLLDFNKEQASPQVSTTLGDWQLSMYNDSTALAYYNEALELAPDFPAALLGKAETYRITRRYDEFFPVLNQFVCNPETIAVAKADYLGAIVSRSDAKFMRIFRNRIDTVVNNTLATHPSDTNVINLVASYYYRTDRKELADGYFLKNIENYPQTISPYASYLLILLQDKRWKEASDIAVKAIGQFSDNANFYELARAAYYQMEDYDKVLEINAIQLKRPDLPDEMRLTALSSSGDIYYLKGDLKAMSKAYDKALKIDPGYCPVLNNYAYYLSQTGRKLKKAYAMSKITIEKEPDNPTYLDTFGWILHLMGKDLEAKPFFKHAMLYGGKDSAVVLDHYATVLFGLKEFDLAFLYWKQCKDKGGVEGLDAKVQAMKALAGRK